MKGEGLEGEEGEDSVGPLYVHTVSKACSTGLEHPFCCYGDLAQKGRTELSPCAHCEQGLGHRAGASLCCYGDLLQRGWEG